MFRKILVPVDLTDKNARAVRIARDLARDADGHVTLLHIIETLDLPFEEVKEFYDRLETRAAREMSALAEPLRDADVDFEEHIAYGKRAHEIVRHSERNDVDLIILSSHRVDRDRPGPNLGTISYKVAFLARGPVLLVK